MILILTVVSFTYIYIIHGYFRNELNVAQKNVFFCSKIIAVNRSYVINYYNSNN